MNAAARELDTVIEVETPEGVLLELHPAGLLPRAYAWLVDALIRYAVVYVLALVLILMGGVGLGLLLVGVFVLEWFYPVIFELTPSGATPGKRMLGLTVVMDDGLPVTPAASFTRNILRVADFLPFLFGAGIVSMLLRRDFKRLGDLAAGTIVVYRRASTAAADLGTLEPQAPAIPLTPRAQAAVIAFAARLPRLTSARADELAALAAPVTGVGEEAGRELTQRLRAVAQWLLGRR